MAVQNIFYNATTKVVTLKLVGGSVPAGSTKIGEYDHTVDAEDDTAWETPENHVDYHHVQDALYKVGQLNMQIIKIYTDYTIPPTGIVASAPGGNLAVAATRQITVVWTPTNVTDKGLTYVSSDPTKATVSASGLVTGVAAGTTNITVSSTMDNTKTSVVAITVA